MVADEEDGERAAEADDAEEEVEVEEVEEDVGGRVRDAPHHLHPSLSGPSFTQPKRAHWRGPRDSCLPNHVGPRTVATRACWSARDHGRHRERGEAEAAAAAADDDVAPEEAEDGGAAPSAGA